MVSIQNNIYIHFPHLVKLIVHYLIYESKFQGTSFTVKVPGHSAELLLATCVDILVSIAGAVACGITEGAGNAWAWVG